MKTQNGFSFIMRAHDGAFIDRKHTSTFFQNKTLKIGGLGFLLVSKMKIILVLALIVAVNCEIKEEGSVLVVTTDNWDEVVKDDANVLVEFCKCMTTSVAMNGLYILFLLLIVG